MNKTDYTKKFSHKNKMFKFKPFNTQGGKNVVTKSNQITMSKSGYYFSYGWTKRYGYDAYETHYLTWGMPDNGVMPFAIAKGEEGKSALEEMLGVSPCKIGNREDPASHSGFGGSCSSLYRFCLSDLYAEICETGKKVFDVEEYPSDGEDELVRWFYFEIPNFDKSWANISASELDADTSLSHVNGVYKYFDANDNLIYIGQGSIRDRYRNTSEYRSSWGIERIEYLESDDKEERRSLEKELIREFEEEHGHLPKFNKTRGG